MRKEIEKYELFERYLKGELSDHERKLFDKQISSDPLFAKEFNAHKQLFDIITDHGLVGIKESIKKIHNSRIKFNRIIKQWTIGFSIITIGLLSYYFVNSTLNKNTEKTEIQSDTVKSDNQTKIVHNDSTIKIKEYTIQEGKQVMSNNDEKSKSDITEKKDGLAKETKDNELKLEIPKIIEPIAINDHQKDSTVGISNDEIKMPITDISDQEKDSLKKVDCSQIEIFVDIKTEESCDNKATGKIIFDIVTITGGEEPYSVSIDDGRNYYSQFTYNSLKSGLYQLFIKDKNDCVSKLGAFRIETKKCSYEHIFAPLKGELWEVPTQNKSGKLIIFSKNGNIVFTRNIEEYEIYKWDGNTENHKALSMGMYRFEIEFNDHSKFFGTITIAR